MHSDETRIYIALLITAVVLAIILTFFMISLIGQHKKNLQLHKEKIQAEIITLEKERSRFVSDLHDEIGPVLSAVKLQISSVTTENKQDRVVIANAKKYIDESLFKIREIANNHMPTALLRKGLLSAISEFAENINYLNKICIECTFNLTVLNLKKEKEIHLYRIIQEIIHNSIKHSYASKIAITLSDSKDMLTVRIKDNGVGFNYAKTLRENTGVGLKSIHSRIEMIEGALYLDAAEGTGVDYTIEVPYK